MAENQEVKSKKKFYKKWWFWVLIVFLLIFIIGLSSPSKPVPPPSQQLQPEIVPAIKISALQLSEEYNANKVAADQKYKDKILEVSGIIDSIGKDILDTPYISLKGREFSLFGIQCMFDKSQEDKLAKLIKGQSIIITGKVSGEIIGNVILRNCNF